MLDPISLLACKLELAATVPQKDRQDVTHLKILLPCVRAFLGELLGEVELGRLPARTWLKVAGQVLKLTSGNRARKVGKEIQIHWQGILPLKTIAASNHEKIRRFRERLLDPHEKRLSDPVG